VGSSFTEVVRELFLDREAAAVDVEVVADANADDAIQRFGNRNTVSRERTGLACDTLI
jgi:hypothetical protein